MATDFRTSAGDNVVYVDSLNIAGVEVTGWRVTKHAGAAFAGGTVNGHGDFDGTGNPYKIFDVEGIVEAKVFGVVNVDLTGASATVAVGVASNTALLLASATGTDLDINEIWTKDSTPIGVNGNTLPATSFIVKSDIIETAGTANVTAGQIDYYCIWRPVSSDGAVTSA